jgi:hypothetical protein
MYDTGFGKLEQILDQQSQILTQQAQILQNQETLAQEIKAQVVKLIDLVQSNGTKKKPGPILFIIAGEDQMADKIIFRVVLPNASAADVKTREITVDIDGEVLCWVTDVVGTTSYEFTGPQGAQVCVTLVDIDDAGNRSEPASLTQQLTDNFAPPAPGAIGFEFVNEIHDHDDTVVIDDSTVVVSDEEVESDVATPDTVDDLDADTIDDLEDEFSTN